MKKNKLLRISVIAMCLVMLMFGVWAVSKNARLDVDGTVGFVAHDCEVEVYGQITGAVSDVHNMDGNVNQTFYLVDYSGTGEFSPVEPFLVKDNVGLTFEDNLWGNNAETTLYENVPVIYFNDFSNEVPQITFSLFFRNISKYDVYYEVTTGFPENIEVSTSNGYKLTKGQTEFTQYDITLKLIDNEENIEVVPNETNLEILVNFYKAPILPAPTNVNYNQITNELSFDVIDDATAYEVRYYDTNGSLVKTESISLSEISNGKVILDEIPEDSGSYALKLVALKSQNGDTIISPESKGNEFTVFDETTFKFETNQAYCSGVTYNYIKLGQNENGEPIRWILLGTKNHSTGAITYTFISKDILYFTQFSDTLPYEYSTSKVRQTLIGEIDGEYNDIFDFIGDGFETDTNIGMITAIDTVDLRDCNIVDNDKFYLLSTGQLSRYFAQNSYMVANGKGPGDSYSTANDWWLRSAYENHDEVYHVHYNYGGKLIGGATGTKGVRPVFNITIGETEQPRDTGEFKLEEDKVTYKNVEYEYINFGQTGSSPIKWIVIDKSYDLDGKFKYTFLCTTSLYSEAHYNSEYDTLEYDYNLSKIRRGFRNNVTNSIYSYISEDFDTDTNSNMFKRISTVDLPDAGVYGSDDRFYLLSIDERKNVNASSSSFISSVGTRDLPSYSNNPYLKISVYPAFKVEVDPNGSTGVADKSTFKFENDQITIGENSYNYIKLGQVRGKAINWIVIDQVDNDDNTVTYTFLSEGVIYSEIFYERNHLGSSNEYKSSIVRNTLVNASDQYDDIFDFVGGVHDTDTNRNTLGMMDYVAVKEINSNLKTEKFYLLSNTEVEALPLDVRAIRTTWVLRSNDIARTNEEYIDAVDSTGGLTTTDVLYYGNIRPAFKITLSK